MGAPCWTQTVTTALSHFGAVHPSSAVMVKHPSQMCGYKWGLVRVPAGKCTENGSCPSRRAFDCIATPHLLRSAWGPNSSPGRRLCRGLPAPMRRPCWSSACSPGTCVRRGSSSASVRLLSVPRGAPRDCLCLQGGGDGTEACGVRGRD